MNNKDANDKLMNDGEAGLKATVDKVDAELDAKEEAAKAAAAQAAERAKAEQEAAARTYRDTQSNAGKMGDFRDARRINTATPPVATGFNNLDMWLGGGLYPGLYTIGALSALGKTTFILQIATHIAEKGRDVLFFCFEMNRYELMAKDISRQLFLMAQQGKLKTVGKNLKPGDLITEYARSARQILNGYVITGDCPEPRTLTENQLLAIKEAEEAYNKYAGHIYTIESGLIADDGKDGKDKENGETKEDRVVKTAKEIIARTQEHIKYMKADSHSNGTEPVPPVVFIDYLQLIAPEEDAIKQRHSDKQNTTDAVVMLKKMAKKLPIVLVSSFNRATYGGDADMGSFKNSGEIEYTSDILIKLEKTKIEKESEKLVTDENKKTKRVKEKRLVDAPADNNGNQPVTATILKNRYGHKDVNIGFIFDGAHCYYEEIKAAPTGAR